MDIPEVINSTGGALAAVILAAVGWQAKRVGELSRRVSELEANAATDHIRFRDAIRCIRDLLAHVRDLTGFIREHIPDAPPVRQVPTIPDSIKDEV